MANIDNVQLPDGSSYDIVDNTSGFATQNYVDSAVSSVTKTTIGLGNVDNTSDLNKPISTATQAALNTLDEDKADKTDIATIESGTTASRPYSVGELVYVSGTLYRVKTAIASGATFTVGTNVEVTNVSNAIKEVDKGSVSVTADGVKTFATLLSELQSLVDYSKVDAKSVLMNSVKTYHVSQLGGGGVSFTFTVLASSAHAIETIGLGTTPSYYTEYADGTPTITITNITSVVAPNGTVITLYY